jgi:hypothetical protein
VEHWFHGDGGSNEELLADAAAAGIELPASMFKPKLYEVWPENWGVVEMFLRVQTQWRTTSGGVIGLDYGVVLQMASLSGSPDPLALLEDLYVMEVRARELLNKAAEKK